MFIKIISIYFSFSILAFSQDKVIEKNLIVNIPNSKNLNQSIYITGDFNQCNWKPNCLKLTKIDHSQYHTQISLNKNAEYKVTRGSWDTEETTSLGKTKDNRILKYNNDIEIINTSAWNDTKIKFVTGQLQIIKLFSKELNKEKIIRVWLPKSYNTTLNSYPVIYAHDAQNLFDPNTATYGNEWRLDETMLNKKFNLPEAIIVGIDSPTDGKARAAEFNFFLRGKKYSEFIIKTLRPYINKTFRSYTDRKNTFLLGSSYGASISFTTIIEHPDIFSKAACLSFYTHGQNNFLFKYIQQLKIIPSNIKIYIDYGGFGFDTDYENAFLLFQKYIKLKNLNQTGISFKKFPFANHTELDWSKRVHIPLSFLLK